MSSFSSETKVKNFLGSIPEGGMVTYGRGDKIDYNRWNSNSTHRKLLKEFGIDNVYSEEVISERFLAYSDGDCNGKTVLMTNIGELKLEYQPNGYHGDIAFSPYQLDGKTRCDHCVFGKRHLTVFHCRSTERFKYKCCYCGKD